MGCCQDDHDKNILVLKLGKTERNATVGLVRMAKHKHHAIPVLSQIVVPWLLLVAGATATAPGSCSGNPDCPCINSSQIIEAASNCRAEDGSAGMFFERGGIVACYSSSYGSSVCHTHDLLHDPLCKNNSGTNHTAAQPPPAYCHQSFCYVDASKCKLAQELFYKSSFQSPTTKNKLDLYYSYTTCNSTEEPWQNFTTMDVFQSALHNKPLSIAVPILSVPGHWKANISDAPLDGDEHYYDDNIAFQGWMVDYISAVLSIASANFVGVKFTHVSVGASSLLTASDAETNRWTQAVYDVKAGIVDAAIPMWATSDL